MPLTLTRSHVVLCLAYAGVLACVSVSAYESHRTRLTIESTVHAAPASQPATHVVCRAGKLQDVTDKLQGDVAVTVTQDPDNGPMVNGMAASVAQAKCSAGKL